MEQIQILNRDQLIQLAGLAAGADSQYLLVTQVVPEDITKVMAPLLTPPLMVQRMVNGEWQRHAMTATGLHVETR
jgi:hypothetical protein